MLTPKDAILFKIVRTCAMTPKAAILFKIVHTCAKECLILKYKYVQNPWLSPEDQNYIINLLFDDTWMIDDIHRYIFIVHRS